MRLKQALRWQAQPESSRLAVVLAAVTVGLVGLLSVELSATTYALIALAGISVVALWSGIRPTFLAIVLLTVGLAYFVDPKSRLAAGALGVLSFACFVATAVLVSVITNRERTAQLATTLERREAEPRAAQRRLAAIVEDSDDAIISKDLDGVIQTWNDGARRLFGYEANEVIGRPLRMLIPPERQREEDEILERLRAGERSAHLETVRLAKGGRPIEVSVTVSPVRDEHGNIIGASKIARDITERRRAESVLQEADRRKTEFLGVLSHELRNPLTAVRTSIHVLKRKHVLDESGQRAASVIERQVDHLAALVEDLLDVTRIERGKVRLHLVKLDFSETVRQAVDDLAQVLQKNQLELQLCMPDEPVWVSGDPVRLSQIVANLLRNAAKFTPNAGRISVSLARDGSDHATLEVLDTGVGIDQETLGKLFVPFVQAQHSLARTAGGLGLGLALVKGFAELHGGTVRAESNGRGQGARFTIRLPVTEAGSADDVPARLMPAVAYATSSKRVLVVEDNQDAADSLQELLRLAGHVVEVAYTGKAGLRRARAFRPDVVLCDIGLPDIDGYEVARAMHDEPFLASTTFVALTGYAQPEDRQRALRAGFSAHIAKPPDLNALERVIQGALN